MPPTQQPQKDNYLTGGQVAFLVICAFVLLGTLGWRYFAPPTNADATLPATSSAVKAGSTPPADDTASKAPAFVPYLTAAAAFGLVGFAVGYVLRKTLFFLLVLVGVVAAVAIGLSMTKVVPIDWAAGIDWLNHAALGLKEKLPPAEALAHHIPSAAVFSLGCGMGLRRRPAA